MAEKKTNEQYQREIKELGYSTEYEYINTRTSLRTRCNRCGHDWMVKPNNLLSGKGCPNCAVERRKKALIKTNDILEDNGDWVLIDVSTKKYPNRTSKFDKVDFLGFERKLYMSDQGYVKVHPKNSRRTVKAHRLLNPDWKVTDHINGDKSDNRRSNLRSCTVQQNTFNSKVQCNNKSGYSGVFWDNRNKKWIASIKKDYKKIHLGCFADKDDAIKTRLEAEKRFFGEYALSNR